MKLELYEGGVTEAGWYWVRNVSKGAPITGLPDPDPNPITKSEIDRLEVPQLSPEEQADATALFNPATPEQQKQAAKGKGKAGKGGWSLTNAGYETLDKLIVLMEERHPGIKDASEAVQTWLLKYGYSNDHLNDPAKAEKIIEKAREAKP